MAVDSDLTWRPTRRSDAFDVALAAFLLVGGGLSLYIGTDERLYGDMADFPRVPAVLAVAAIVVPLAVRRRYPLAVLAAATVAYVPLSFLRIPEYTVAPVSYFIALYSAGAYGGRRRHLLRAVGTTTIVALVLYELATPDQDFPGGVNVALVNTLTAVSNVFYLAAAWMLGDLVHNRRQREATLVAQADALRSMQAERSLQAVREEQVRIARELHDVVAHHVSVMGVQAGAARHVLRNKPDAVPDLLSQIEGSSRQAVTELQQMLRLLRRDDEAGGNGTDPQPTLGRLDALVEQMRDAGLSVAADVEGVTGGLPPGVDLSAYRIVQEALTNTLKHAGPGTTASVAVVRRLGSLEIVVTDDGCPGPTPPRSAGAGPGHGLVGMRERVALLGGELKTGRRSGGGFQVRAWLPLRQRAEAGGGR